MSDGACSLSAEWILTAVDAHLRENDDEENRGVESLKGNTQGGGKVKE